MRWLREIRAHFASRAELTGPEVLLEFGVDTEHADELEECLAVFEAEYGVKLGWLRASDSLEHFTRLPRSNLWSWLFVQFAYEDRLSELNYNLKVGRAKRGIEEDFPIPETIGDYVHIYLGMANTRDGE